MATPLPLIAVLLAAAGEPAAAQPAAPAAPAESAAVPVLTLEEAVQNALSAQPTIRQARAQTRAAQARTGTARSGLLPQVNANLQYQRSTANFAARPGSVPSQFTRDQESSFDTFNYFSGGLTASQLVWDFGQTRSQWRASQENARAQGYVEESTRQLAVLAARNAFFNARGAKALWQVAEQTVANQRRHLEQAQGFYEVGTRPRLDVVQARADLANAEVQRIQAQNTYQTSKVQLNQAMGREGPPRFEVADDALPPVEGEEAPSTELVKKALAARPEFGQLESQLRAQELQVRSLQGGYLPTFGVATSVQYGGTELNALAWNWSAQATLTWPLFSGLATQSQVREAEANTEALRAQRDSVRQQVEVEVEQVRLAIEAAKATLVAAEQALQSAQERLTLAEGRYQTGAGNIIELGDAQVAATNAAAQRVQAEYQLAAARAQLLKALGVEVAER